MMPLHLVIYGLTFLALVFGAFGVVAFRLRRRLGGTMQFVFAGLLLALATIGGLALIGTAGYRSLTRETLAATITISLQEPQRYRTEIEFPDGERRTFIIAGDELYLDAHILKWHPAVNLLGLHTGYRLDRVAGRYQSIDDEQQRPRSVYQLRDSRPLDLFRVAERFPLLTPLVDAEYGSGTFVPLTPEGRYEVMVSTNGLLIREIVSP